MSFWFHLLLCFTTSQYPAALVHTVDHLDFCFPMSACPNRIILVSYCCVVDCRKCSGLKQHAFVTPQFCAQKSGKVWLVLCSGSHNVQCGQGRGSAGGSVDLGAEFKSCDRRTEVPGPLQLSAGDCSEFLEAIQIPCHEALFIFKASNGPSNLSCASDLLDHSFCLKSENILCLSRAGGIRSGKLGWILFDELHVN